MRLLMTADAVGGVWTYGLELARALAPFGVDTTLAVMGPKPDANQIANASTVPGLTVASKPFRLEWMPDAWADVDAAGEWLLELAERVRPSVVHVNGYAHAALAWQSPCVAVGHSCVVSWHEAVGGAFDPVWLSRYRRVVCDGLRAADVVVAPSAAMLASLQRHYGPLENVAVVPNGRTASLFQRGPKHPLVFTAGRAWDRAKNIEALLDIAPRLTWPVVLAGDTGERTMNTAQVFAVGQRSEAEIAALLARASLFVLPARYEPFGLLPLEAALAGCALVLGDIASLREVWGDAATYVDPDDRDALRAAIERLIANPSLLAARAAAAYRQATRYSPARMAERYLQVYRSQLSTAGVGESVPLKAAAANEVVSP
jgi:glycogen synthase